jgi:hypothetical protein
MVFTPTTNMEKNEQHTYSNHSGWPVYPSIADLKILDIYSRKEMGKLNNKVLKDKNLKQY